MLHTVRRKVFMSRNKLRVGVIGVGYVASNNFLPVFPRFDDVELSGIMANHLESAKKAQRLCGAQQVVQSLEELVKLDLDCAFVLTPKACHAEQISFLPVEKPSMSSRGYFANASHCFRAH